MESDKVATTNRWILGLVIGTSALFLSMEHEELTFDTRFSELRLGAGTGGGFYIPAVMALDYRSRKYVRAFFTFWRT